MTDIANTEEQAAALAHTIEGRIKRTMRNLRTAWVGLAEDLFRFQQEEMWRHLGYDSFDAWLADPDVSVERRWAYQLIATWRETVVKRKVEPSRLETIEPSKLQEVLPAVRRGYITMEEGFADVEALSRTDLRVRYSGRASEPSPNGSRPDTSSRLDASSEPRYLRCPTCGSRVEEGQIR
jgi:hypothetical protein